MPAIGIGCWMGAVGESQEVTDMVLKALSLGYRHIDTASNYGNEYSVGKAIRESNIPRSEIFLVTKLSSEDHARPLEALQRSLDKLGVQSVDLYLMHWPMSIENDRVCSPDESPFTETWKMMESLVETGLCITVIRLPF